MISFLVLLVLCTGALVDGEAFVHKSHPSESGRVQWLKEWCCLMSLAGNTYSYSTSVGSGIGTAFSLSSDGGSRIDAIRVYEAANAYITGSVAPLHPMRNILGG